MKLSGGIALSGLGFTSAWTSEIVCEPSTVYSTVTVTAPYGGGNTIVPPPITPTIPTHGGNPSTGSPVTYGGSSYIAPPYVTTAGPTVTSVDYGYSQTSVWVYPTGDASSKDCVVAIYEEETITVVIINISIYISNGVTTTVTSTVTDAPPPSSTPYLPPPPSTTSTYITPPSTTVSSTGTTHTITVGADGQLEYRENAPGALVGQLNVTIGDVLRFDFNATNHTVTQSSFAQPCTPLMGGFNTGFNQVTNTTGNPKNFRDFTVTVATPLWFYCAQTVKVSHCHKGMVLGVNPAGKFPAFLSMATMSATSSATAVGTVGTGLPTLKMGPGPVKFTTPPVPAATASKRQVGYWVA